MVSGESQKMKCQLNSILMASRQLCMQEVRFRGIIPFPHPLIKTLIEPQTMRNIEYVFRIRQFSSSIFVLYQLLRSASK